jgi:hypothetical protein
MTTGRRPVRNRNPAGKIYWDSAAAHRGHREWAQCGTAINSELYLQPYQRLDDNQTKP